MSPIVAERPLATADPADPLSGAAVRRVADSMLSAALKSTRLTAAYAEGRLSPAQSRKVTATVARSAAAVARLEAEALVGRLTNVTTWETRTRTGLLGSYLAAARAATGRHGLPPDVAAAVGQAVTKQIGYLSNFARQVRSGDQPRDGRVPARAEMYGAAAWSVAEAARGAEARRAGLMQYQSVLGFADHCSQCLSESSRGWVAVGSLIPIGDRTCKSRCSCWFSYRKDPAEFAVLTTEPPPRPEPPPGPVPPRYGTSEAEVVFEVGDEQTFREFARHVFGRDVSPADVASSVGATDDATVKITPHAGRLYVTVDGPGYSASRSVYRQGNDLVISNTSFHVDEDKQGRGLGSTIFGRQVEQAIRLGVDRLMCEAAGEKGSDMNGYITWPKFGYDGDIPYSVRGRIDAGKLALPPGHEAARTVGDLMTSKGGRDWWTTHGKSFDATFDLGPGSRSRQVWDAYRAGKAKAGPAQ